jgi:hypothetical protein
MMIKQNQQVQEENSTQGSRETDLKEVQEKVEEILTGELVVLGDLPKEEVEVELLLLVEEVHRGVNQPVQDGNLTILYLNLVSSVTTTIPLKRFLLQKDHIII